MEALKIYPELTKWKETKNGTAALTIRFDFAGNRVGNEPLHEFVKLSDWDDKKRLLKNCSLNSEMINQLIENRINAHKNYFLRRKTFNLPVTKELVKRYIKCGALEDFYMYATQVLKTKILPTGKNYDADTIRRYTDEINRLLLFKPVLSLRDINEDFLTAYRFWLIHSFKKKDGNPMHKNSVWKTFAFIRMIYNTAVKERIILQDVNPFKKFDVGKCEQDTDKIKWLELAHIEAIEGILKLPDNLLPITRAVGWRFLSMCVSGLRISDAMYLDEYSFNDKGDLALIPHKTRHYGNKASIPIVSERQRFYLQQALAHPLPKTNHKSFRSTFNIHLHIIAAKAGVTVHLTSHVGRHTMGSFLVDAGVEKKAAMAMLGVKKESVIETYMHLKQSKLQKEANKLKNVF